MKTIIERAKEWFPDPWDADCILPAREGYIVGQQRQGYISGANEQKAIDIEKACKWFADYLMEIGYPDDWMRDSPNMASGKERFIKAMEEEL